MYGTLKDQLADDLAGLKTEGLFKAEAVISTPQSARITVGDQTLINFCANNYLGLADHPAMIAAAQQALDRWGFGMASVRFICGTAEIHKELERRIAHFLGTEDAILYGSCFDANGGLFETLLGSRGRRHLRRAESCEHHRRRTAVQGHSDALRQQGHGRSRSRNCKTRKAHGTG